MDRHDRDTMRLGVPGMDTMKVRCRNCGSMTTEPYVHHKLPSSPMYDIKSIPIYSKNGTKIRRVDLTGERKISVQNYCDRECYETSFQEI